MCPKERLISLRLAPPFFLQTFLAQKYGYRPFPPKIDALEFETILDGVDDEDDKKLLSDWFLRDDNSVPPVYYLTPVRSKLPHYANDEAPDLRAKVRKPSQAHDDVIKWKHFPCYWPFVRGIHRPPVNSPHKGQWRGALIFSLICAWINGCINNDEAGDLRCHRAHYDVTVMWCRDSLVMAKMSRSAFAVKVIWISVIYRSVDSGLAPSQWETSLQSNTVSHWKGAYLGSALYVYVKIYGSHFF